VSARRCCEPRTGLARRGLPLAGGLGPILLIAALPKCPACIAAWLLIATGAGISTAVASELRILMVLVCFAPAVYLMWGRRFCLTMASRPATCLFLRFSNRQKSK
jgi:hypothetical protein